MKILILCDMFPPAFGPRMGYLCKYLRHTGWEPTVITEYIPEETFAFLKGDTDVTYIRFYKAKQGFIKTLEWIKVMLADLLFGYKNRRMYREALKQTRKQPFHLILCSTYRTFPLPAARRIARKAGLPLVVDLRDIFEQAAGDEFFAHSLPKLGGIEKGITYVFKKINLYQRNRVLRKSKQITTVSPWHVDVLKRYNPNVTLIYNGYDPELFYPAPILCEQFYITYTGRLVNTAMRNPELLFQAIAKLSEEQIITPDTFRIRWFTDEKSQQILQEEVRNYPISEYMDYYGYVPASRIPVLLNESAILLLLTNKASESGPKGVMTTKFFEALAVEKPILCVRGDEGCLEEAIQCTQSGLSAHHMTEVYRFIREHYRQWQVSKSTIIHPNHSEIRKFSRQAQANQFIRIFDQITHP
ncbi:MAG: glycosyltransferase [Tannerella sp.]|nr:glycosyltransferase [Tannerella sp.]